MALTFLLAANRVAILNLFLKLNKKFLQIVSISTDTSLYMHICTFIWFNQCNYSQFTEMSREFNFTEGSWQARTNSISRGATIWARVKRCDFCPAFPLKGFSWGKGTFLKLKFNDKGGWKGLLVKIVIFDNKGLRIRILKKIPTDKIAEISKTGAPSGTLRDFLPVFAWLTLPTNIF